MKSLRKKLFLSILAVAFAVVSLATSTFAWFSMNNRVTVTGMVVKTNVSTNLLIAETNAEANYGIALDQTREGTLEPVSSVDGVSFFYTATSNVVASGDAKTDAYTAYAEGTSISHAAANKTQYDAAFNSNYGFTSPVAGFDSVAYGYMDYTFFLKGTNSDSEARKIFIDTCNLLYNGSAITDKAFRVAVFAIVSAKDEATTGEVAVGNLKAILAPASATYFTSGKAVAATSGELDTAVSNLGSRAVIAELAAGATAYYKVTIRLWLEGEDTTCKNDTYATLTGAWSLDLGIKLGDSGVSDANAVNQIGSVAVATLTPSSNVGTAALTLAGETASTYEFFNAKTRASIGAASATATYTNADTENSIDVYCVITTVKGNKYVTPVATLAKKTA